MTWQASPAFSKQTRNGETVSFKFQPNTSPEYCAQNCSKSSLNKNLRHCQHHKSTGKACFPPSFKKVRCTSQETFHSISFISNILFSGLLNFYLDLWWEKARVNFRAHNPPDHYRSAFNEVSEKRKGPLFTLSNCLCLCFIYESEIIGQYGVRRRKSSFYWNSIAWSLD